MKIAFITRSLGGGGAERVVSVLANSFVNNPSISKVYVIAVIEDYVTYPIDSKVIYIANQDKTKNKIIRVAKRLNYLKKQLNDCNPDVVISFCTQINIYSIFATKKNKKLIISERNDPNNDPIQRWVRKFRNIVYSKVDGAVFQTEDAAMYFKKIIHSPTAIIMNPVAENLPMPYRGERDNRIVTVARLSKEKNLELLIKAFSRISKEFPQYTLEIYGQGPEKNRLNSIIQNLGMDKKIFLKGYSTQVHQDILTAKCFVLPSNYEGISNAMLEAMALGIPTICTDCPIGGARMVIRNMDNGILTRVNDQLDLEKNIIKLLGSLELQMKISKNAEKNRDIYSVKNISNQWYEFVNKIVRN